MVKAFFCAGGVGLLADLSPAPPARLASVGVLLPPVVCAILLGLAVGWRSCGVFLSGLFVILCASHGALMLLGLLWAVTGCNLSLCCSLTACKALLQVLVLRGMSGFEEVTKLLGFTGVEGFRLGDALGDCFGVFAMGTSLSVSAVDTSRCGQCTG